MLRNLLSPCRIGTLELRNRIAMAPMGVEIAEADGKVREPLVRYYEERARGGVGLIVTENTSATYPAGANSAHELGVSSDDFLPGLRALTEGVHAHGTKIAIQLAHHGKTGRLDTQQGRELLMPSIPRKPQGPSGPLDMTREEIELMMQASGGGPPKIREATVEDLQRLAADFADAAERAQRAGFDAVELHGAHGYIFSEFLSPAWNFREDEYGGSVENRSRLLCETLRACKERTGGDFPVWCRIDATEFGVENGIQPDDAQRTAELLAEAGADAISVSAYANPIGAGFTRGPIVHEKSGFAPLAAAIKARVSVPVIVSGRIEPEAGDRLIADGKADIIKMGRKLLADPELPNKLAEGRADEVRPCIYCYVCVAQPFFDRSVRCSVNPVLPREAELAETLRTASQTPKRVIVVGAGPGGMEAARVAALRGHEVVLIEKSKQLGGTLRFAALPYEPNEVLLRWYERQMELLPVQLRLGEEASAASLRALEPDVVIAALGARRTRPAVPGAELPHVLDGDDLRDMLAGASSGGGALSRIAIGAGRALGITADPSKLRLASKAYMPLGKRVVIVGGGLVGVELAEFLLERKREVVLLEAGPVMATEMAHPRRWRELHVLREGGARLVNNATVEEIGAQTVRFREGDGEAETLPADSVLLAEGLGPNPDGLAAFDSLEVPVIAVGDASGVGYIEGAIREGFEAAIAL